MNRKEYNICVDNYSDAVYRFVLKSIGDQDDAADIVQEAFVRMWEKSENISFEKSKSYLFSTAYHIMIDFIRKQKRINYNIDFADEFASNSFSTNESYSNFDLKSILNEALNKLPLIQKSVILIRDYEGYSYEEIGDITELSESQVKVYIYRGRIALKNYIKSLDLVL